MTDTLLVIVPDYLSAIIDKGELQPRYYNPGELFDEVHFLLINPDQPDLDALQYTVGSARLYVHNLPEPTGLHQLPWCDDNHSLLVEWAKPAVELAKAIEPQLIRCHTAELNVYVASRIKREIGIPYVVSLHINPDVNATRRFLGEDLDEEMRSINRLFGFVESEGLCNADLVMPVYQPIEPYLKRLGVDRYEVCYNVLNGRDIVRKSNYRLHDPVRIVCVGRQFDEKDPSNLLRAVARIPEAMITLVGSGNRHDSLKALAKSLQLGERVTFQPAVHNVDLCRTLAENDIFAIHTNHYEISKSLLEAMLAGLPIVLNRRTGDPVPELEGLNFIEMVEDTPDAYEMALRSLIEDDKKRAKFGRRTQQHAWNRYDPAKTEARFVDIYRTTMLGRSTQTADPVTNGDPPTLRRETKGRFRDAQRVLCLLPAAGQNTAREGAVSQFVRRIYRRMMRHLPRVHRGEQLSHGREPGIALRRARKLLAELDCHASLDVIADSALSPLLASCNGLFRSVSYVDGPLENVIQNDVKHIEQDVVVLALQDPDSHGFEALGQALVAAGRPTVVFDGSRRYFELTSKALASTRKRTALINAA